jgi:hypothetical protein
VLKIWPVPSKDGLEGNPIPVGIGFLGIQYTNHGLAWDRLGRGITKVVSEALAEAMKKTDGLNVAEDASSKRVEADDDFNPGAASNPELNEALNQEGVANKETDKEEEGDEEEEGEETEVA